MRRRQGPWRAQEEGRSGRSPLRLLVAEGFPATVPKRGRSRPPSSPLYRTEAAPKGFHGSLPARPGRQTGPPMWARWTKEDLPEAPPVVSQPPLRWQGQVTGMPWLSRAHLHPGKPQTVHHGR